MDKNFSSEAYDAMVSALFLRFPSFQKAGATAYKPGIGNMVFFDQLLGHPHRKYRTIHVAGTNGKGSVSNMLASVLAASGLKVGLYTSPHILDFRERMRVVDGSCPGASWALKNVPRKLQDNVPKAEINVDGKAGGFTHDVTNGERGQGMRYISREEVWDFVQRWRETFEHLDLSFFEITTAMAFDWFAAMEVDVAVIETGLGGRLDSTNIINPVLSIITNIGLDHCDMLGGTLPEIAFEKAGIIKPLVPVIVGESHPETDTVFEHKVLYTNLPETEFMGDRKRIMSLLTFADKVEPALWDRSEEILGAMDLQGIYQRKNLRTLLAALDVLASAGEPSCRPSDDSDTVIYAIEHTASLMDFHGRWEKLCDNPYTIADIGHNSHGLKYNFAQLSRMMSGGSFSSLTIIYGAMADKDVDEIMHLFPKEADLIFVTAPGKRAMKAEDIFKAYISSGGDPSRARCMASVREAIASACSGRHGTCSEEARPLVYIGGSTYVVSEAAGIIN